MFQVEGNKYNIIAEQGFDLELYFTWKDALDLPVDLKSVTAANFILRNKNKNEILRLTLNHPELIIDKNSVGTFKLNINQHRLAVLYPDEYLYEFIVYAPSKFRLLKGEFKLYADV
jgi:hypothetical protein